ncbi:MAG: ComEC/Rec2 family competence protein [Roseinatronobacter sp.]
MALLTYAAPPRLGLFARGLEAIARQRGRLFLFVPVFMGIGIGTYFALPAEPAPEWLWASALAAALIAFLGLRVGDDWAPIAMALALVLFGIALAGGRAHSVAAPVLGARTYGVIEGRVLKLDRSSSDAIRLMLDHVWMEGQDKTPERVRLSLHGGHPVPDLIPGSRVRLTGHLGPPPPPAEPGGFDFRAFAWFERLGGVGYTRKPIEVIAPPAPDEWALSIHRMRMAMSRAIQERLPGEAGAFATAILTGDRSAIPDERLEELRRSNLAHLLAISGLHMGLLTGFVFGLLRFVMALVPWVALRLPTRKVAALGALGAAAFYLALSGGNIATQRAFVMVAVMLVAVLVDRQAISLRSVALAAVIILLLRPEALVQAGFQMSFAATIALVAVFRAINDHPDQRSRIPRGAWPVLSVVICSVVAGLATAPIAAAAFNRASDYGLIANLLAVPLMGTVIMPAAVLAALLTPFGLEWVGLAIMRPAILWILDVAAFVSGLEGAVRGIVQPQSWVLPAICAGGLWLVLWQGRARWVGVVVMALALAGWSQATRPDLLIAREGEVVGVLTAQGRVLSRDTAGAFAAESWLQADGDLTLQPDAYALGGQDPRVPVQRLALRDGTEVVHLVGKKALALLPDLCTAGRIVVTNQEPETRPRACYLLTPRNLRWSGARAGWVRADGLVWVLSRDAAGDRLWTRRSFD